ncbi:glycosyltransferase family 2 protein [Salinimicrobium sp. GXAS 041]|uniref:glycosyltransferase family 2 protein n=1 Tax=Salinimicrobium sp. GXAS 041 TaxID=3400806 RepID=UPI003C78F155
MKNSPVVSIVMPAYDASKFISESIDSVRAQTFADWELIIIDDASKDETNHLVKEYVQQDQRIKLHTLPVNQGAGFARNIGIKASEGDFISFLDADDLWKPHKLQAQLDFMRNHKLSMCYSSYELMDEEGRSLQEMVKALEKLTFSKLLKANYVGNLTGIYNAKELGKIYCPPIRKRQDWAMWLQTLKKAGEAKGILEPLATYRMRRGSISANKQEMLQYNYKVYRKVLKFSALKSSYWISRFLYEQFFVKSKQLVKLKQ